MSIHQLQEVLGLIPAAGKAIRLAPLPCSKEIYPIGFGFINGAGAQRPKVACQYLLEKMRAANITKVYIVLRNSKWDIPAYFRGGSLVDMHLGYLVTEPNSGPPYTLDAAYEFVRDAVVAFGFPDILFEGDQVFSRLLSQQVSRDSDILLGLFPADRPEKMDMVEIDTSGRVTDLVIQPAETGLQYSWNVAVWTPAFTEFMHSYLAAQKTDVPQQRDLSVGHVIQAAISSGLRVEAVVVSDQPYCDIGTPEGLAKAIHRFAALD
jgi:glucose-1-phosphate thymidylyltransferase